MFRRIDDLSANTVCITVEGEKISALEGDTVGAALLSAGFEYTRTTPGSGSPRAPYCMMGACFDCLVEIDGIPNQQACQIPVRAGMVVNRQKGARDIDP